MKGTWTTTGSGGPGGNIALVVAGAILAAAVAGPVAAAAAELLHVVVITVAIALGVALAAGGGLVAYRLRRRATPALGWRTESHRCKTLPPPAGAAGSVTAPRPAAIEAPREVHLHLHGVTAEDLAAILARVNRAQG